MNKKADHSVQLKRSENASWRGNRWTHLSSGLLAQLWNIFFLSLLNSKQKSYYGSFVFCVVILLVRCVFEACHLSHWFHGFFSDSLPSPGCIFCRRYSRIQRWPLLVMFASISSSVSTPSSPHPLYTSLVSSTRMTRWESEGFWHNHVTFAPPPPPPPKKEKKNTKILETGFSLGWFLEFFFVQKHLQCHTRRNFSYYLCWKQLCCSVFLWKPWYIFSSFFDEY